jgi:CspA family cold shock protein
MRLTGQVIRFDNVRGFGFITPDGGGDDVFLHASDLEMEKSSARSDARVSFGVAEGERGQYATSVRLVSGSGPDSGESRSAAQDEPPSGEYVEVLSFAEFRHAVTELLLTVTPPLVAPQITTLRTALAEMAQGQGWLED